MAAHISRREKYLELKKSGVNSDEKLMRALNVSIRTLFRLKKEEKEGTIRQIKPKTGRPSKLSSNDMRRISNIATKNPYFSNEKIANCAEKNGSPKVSRFTIGRKLAKAGFNRRKPTVVPDMNERQRIARVDWCRKYRDFDWAKVVISDESSFQLRADNIKILTRSKKCYMKMPKFQKKLMIWGAISERGCTELHFVTGGMDTDNYLSTLNATLIEPMKIFYPDGYFFQQDNAPAHRAKKTKDWLRHNDINLIEWPANSPDLSPIENVWGVIKREISKQQPKNYEDLQEKIKSLWLKYAPGFVGDMTCTMRKRIDACLANNGETIRV